MPKFSPTFTASPQADRLVVDQQFERVVAALIKLDDRSVARASALPEALIFRSASFTITGTRSFRMRSRMRCRDRVATRPLWPRGQTFRGFVAGEDGHERPASFTAIAAEFNRIAAASHQRQRKPLPFSLQFRRLGRLRNDRPAELFFCKLTQLLGTGEQLVVAVLRAVIVAIVGGV